MECSDNIADLAAALAKARGTIKNPPLDKENPHFRSKYATLAACRDAVEAAFTSNGLSLVQSPVTRDGEAGVDWLLTHSSGQWLSGACLLPVDKKNAQGVGSSLTYSRRYVLMSVAGIIGDDDDDGNAAAGAAPPPAKAKAPPKKPATEPEKPADPQHVVDVRKRIESAGCKDKKDGETVISYLLPGKTGDMLRASPEAAKEFCDSFDAALEMHKGKSLLAVAKASSGTS